MKKLLFLFFIIYNLTSSFSLSNELSLFKCNYSNQAFGTSSNKVFQNGRFIFQGNSWIHYLGEGHKEVYDGIISSLNEDFISGTGSYPGGMRNFAFYLKSKKFESELMDGSKKISGTCDFKDWVNAVDFVKPDNQVYVDSAKKINWYSLNICETSKISECKNVGKNIYLYNSIVKREFKIGPIVGVVYLKKGQNRGTNQVRLAERTGYYYLIDDMGDKNNLLTVLPTEEHSFK